MTVLVVHNRYQHRGGEDTVFEAECGMLERNGHRVVRYEMDNLAIDGMGRISLLLKTIWNRSVYRALCDVVRREKPDVAHFHNIFPLISPAAYYACKRMGVPVVQTLHNYRLVCLNACLFRRGKICEACLGRIPWRGVARKCYRGSVSASVVAFAALMVHRVLGTYRKQVDVYVALDEFGRKKMIQAGFAEGKIVVKPNVVERPQDASPRRNGESRTSEGGGFVIYAGRLSTEKGVDLLIEAWAKVMADERIKAAYPQKPKLLIVGKGAEQDALQQRARESGVDASVEFAGQMPREALLDTMRRAMALVLPSRCYETFALTVAEGFTQGVPAIVADTGAQASRVHDGVTGFHFAMGDASDLARVLIRALTDPATLKAMGEAAFEAICASDSMPERNLGRLVEIYELTLGESRKGGT